MVIRTWDRKCTSQGCYENAVSVFTEHDIRSYYCKSCYDKIGEQRVTSNRFSLADLNREKQQDNLEKVRNWYATHLGCSAKECAKDLNLCTTTVYRHVKTLRKEWQK